jgi:hypothetical protein
VTDQERIKVLREALGDAVQYLGLMEQTLRMANMVDLANIVRRFKADVFDKAMGAGGID